MKAMAWVGLAAVIALGCGSSGSGGSCGKVQPCGGDLHGTWSFSEFCTLDASPDPTGICPSATTTIDGSTISGAATFNADGTYSIEEVFTLAFKLVVPASCVPTGATCADLAATLAPAGDAQVASATCTSSGGGCACKITEKPLRLSEAGSATTAGSTLTTMPDGKPPDAVQYCVDGNEVHVISVDMTMPMGAMGTVKITGDLVATRS